MNEHCAIVNHRGLTIIILLLGTIAFPYSGVCENLPPIVYYDMTPLFQLDLKDPAQLRRFYDETTLAVSLQGLANRERPQLYIRYISEIDDFWWERMTESGGWMQGREIQRIASLEELLNRFRDCYQGAVVWDERVPATSNLAATLAGCDNLLSVRWDEKTGSVYQRFINGGARIPVKKRLAANDGAPLFTGSGTVPDTNLPSTGSAKCDAYLWLIENYVKTGKANPRLMGYYLDAFWLQSWFVSSPQNHTLTNLDYIIANRGVCFDLNCWDDETAVDDPQQKPGTDAKTLALLLRSLYDRLQGGGVIHAAGFTPWAFKYTDYKSGNYSAGGTHGGVPTEWRYAEILSCYNAYMDADALGTSSMANASFFQHFPLPASIPQNPKPTAASLQAQGILDASGVIVPRHYVAHYVGDYDSAAWLYWMLPRMWSDPNRGKVPLSWAFNPNLAARFPLGMYWSRQNSTANDFFTAGDSGAGYLNPGYLSEPRVHSGLPSGVAAWERHCTTLYKQWDVTLTGFVIDGYARGLSKEGLDAYARFSPDGIVPQKIPPIGVHNGMPYLRASGDLPDDATQAAQIIYSRSRKVAPQFYVYRSILKTPSWYLQVGEEVNRLAGETVRIVDLYTLMFLIREYQTHLERYPDVAASFAESKRIVGSSHHYRGVQAVYVEDGPFSVESKGDRLCWRMPHHSPPHYLYFDAADDFCGNGKVTLLLQITFFDEGGEFRLQYDSTDRAASYGGVYKESTQIIQCDNSKQWRTVEFRLEDARFMNEQNNESDFRLVNPGGDLWIGEISIQRMEEER